MNKKNETLGTLHAWWSRLRHQGLLLSPVVFLDDDRFPWLSDAPAAPDWNARRKLKDAWTRFLAQVDSGDERAPEEDAVLTWTDALTGFLGIPSGQVARQGHIPGRLTAAIRIGSRTETIRPHRVVFADAAQEVPALLVMADTSPHVGRGRGRTAYARFVELLRATGRRLGLLTNGSQFRLIYAGLDFESWCEWDADRWFTDAEGAEELNGLRRLIGPKALEASKDGVPALLAAVEDSRKRQADLSNVLRENVRQAVELLLEEVSAAHRTHPALFRELAAGPDGTSLHDAEAQEAMLQAGVRVVMRLVVCLFAESRKLLPVDDPIYAQSYGVRALYELLDSAARAEGGTRALADRRMAWPRLMALFRLVHAGSAHGSFPVPAYGGALFRPGEDAHEDPVSRALYLLEHAVPVRDEAILLVLQKLLRGPLPVVRGRTRTFVEGPVDYTNLRTEFIGLIYEGLLDYRLKRASEESGPQVFLNIGREPVLPLRRLEAMLHTDRNGLKDLLTTLRKEKVAASVSSDEEPEAEEADSSDAAEPPDSEEPVLQDASPVVTTTSAPDYLDADARARQWAREAALLLGLVGRKRKGEPETEYRKRVDDEADRLIKRVVPVGDFYLVRAGNTRKGTGTFYTRPQLAVPTAHRTLQPLCYDKAPDGHLIPKTPQEILALKVCDPACGSASFLVAALHYLTDALYAALVVHADIENPRRAGQATLPLGRRRTGKGEEELLPFPPDDPQRGESFTDVVKALLRRHVVERCIYGVDINPLAVEFARVSLWIETFDKDLPFSFLDHKVKVGNALVGCWLRHMLDYPLKAWERNGGDDPDARTSGPRTERIETFLKGPVEANGRRSGDGIIKQEMRRIIAGHFAGHLFGGEATPEQLLVGARKFHETMHEVSVRSPELKEKMYAHFEHGPALQRLKRAMDEWCAVWFWPMDEESARHAPTPETFHASDVAHPPSSGVAQPPLSGVAQPPSAAESREQTVPLSDVAHPPLSGVAHPPLSDVAQPPSAAESREQTASQPGAAVPHTATPQPGAAVPHTTPRESLIARLRRDLRFFHWELEFPDVFTPARSGFDAVLGNPPWETVQQESMEFFSEFDPLYRTYDKQSALRRQQELFRALPEVRRLWLDYCGRFASMNNWVRNAANPFNMVLDRGRKGEQLASDWACERKKRIGYALPDVPFRWQGSGKNYTYKLFLEMSHALIHDTGRLGLIVPSGLYTDAGTRDLRTLFLEQGTWEWLFSFENRRKIFDIDSRFKFAPTIVDRRRTGAPMQAAFMVHDVAAWERPDPPVFPFDTSLIPLFSPRSKSLPEVRTRRDLDICRKIYEHSIRIGDNAPGWEITYAQEFNMTSDSRLFPPREKWEAKGYKPDVFGRWIGPEGDVALPLYQGTMLGQLNFSEQGFASGSGRSNHWEIIPCDRSIVLPKYMIGASAAPSKSKMSCAKLAFRDITNATNERTFIGAVLCGLPCGNTAPVLVPKQRPLRRALLFSAALCTLTSDYAARMRIGGTHLNFFIAQDMPVPFGNIPQGAEVCLVRIAACLNFIHRRFAPEWLRLRALYPELGKREWKYWWAVTEADRLRLRVEIDALCAELYGLEPDDFDWIVRDDPSDPKGFWRVDKELPYRERLTGLAAAAFRALKAGQWSADSAAALSNDDFFALLGIPELTSERAAKAKGLSEPLIRKRKGCHLWQPEKFPAADPRHGWTWSHCHADAVALLGSEEAVKDYVEGKTPPVAEPEKARKTKRKAKIHPDQAGLFRES